MREPNEAVEEVPAPLYAWRAYRVEQITHDYDTQWVLTPLYYRHLHAGEPKILHVGKQSEVFIDLLGWNVSNRVPQIDEDNMHGGMPGFHCFHGYGQAVKYAQSALDSSHKITNVIIARVELGGVVVEHEMGYRAEKTRVIELEHPDADEERREKLAAAIGWPFEIAYCDLIDLKPRWHTDIETIERAAQDLTTLVYTMGISLADVTRAVADLADQYHRSRVKQLNDMKDALGNTYQHPNPGAITGPLTYDGSNWIRAHFVNNWNYGGAIPQKPFDLGTGI